MSLTQTIEQDKSYVAAAQASLDAANAKLSADQAALDALAPHIAAWRAVGDYAETVPYDDIKAALKTMVESGMAALDI